jgi:hypothetical protein
LIFPMKWCPSSTRRWRTWKRNTFLPLYTGWLTRIFWMMDCDNIYICVCVCMYVCILLIKYIIVMIINNNNNDDDDYYYYYDNNNHLPYIAISIIPYSTNSFEDSTG